MTMNAPISKQQAIAARDVGVLRQALRSELHQAIDRIPNALKERKAWLAWRTTDINEKGKFNKIPVYPVTGKNRHGGQGSDEDLRNLGTFDEAISALKRDKNLAGIGFALLPQFGVVALDADRCVGPEGHIREDVSALTDLAYTEYSPSGTGVRSFWLGSARTGKNHDTGYELFHPNGFVTVTGSQVPNLHAAIYCDELTTLDAETRGRLEHLSLAKGGSQSQDSPSRLQAAAEQDKGLAAIKAAGLYEREIGQGKHSIECPFEAEHSDYGRPGGDGDTVYFQAHTNGYKEGHIHCSHSHGNDQGRYWHAIGVLLGVEHELTQWQGHSGERERVLAAFAESVGDESSQAERSLFRINAIQAATFAADWSAESWLIKGVFPNAGVGMLYGPPGSGKSFLALEMMTAVARGVTWRDHKVRQSPVLYVAAEGANGARKRFAGYASKHGIQLENLPIYVIAGQVSLLTGVDVDEIAREANSQNVGLIVIDTLAQVSAGADENSGADMGRVLTQCNALQTKTGALVLLVHHTGKDASRGARGWSGMTGAMDTMIEVSREGENRLARVVKQKDGTDAGEYGFRLEVVTLGQDEDGDSITTCVAVEAELANTTRKLGSIESAILAAVGSHYFVGDEPPLAMATIVSKIAADIPITAGKRDRRKEAAKRAVTTLCEDGFLEVKDNAVFLVRS